MRLKEFLVGNKCESGSALRSLTNVATDNHFSVARCARILLDVLAAELER